MNKQNKKHKQFYFYVFILILFAISEFTYSQPNVSYVEYSQEFTFKEGIYRNIDEFLANSPSISKEYLVKENQGAQIWIGEYVKKDKVYATNSSGELQKIRKKDIWGLCDDNKVYVYIDGNFHRIIQFGQICKIMYSKNQAYLAGVNISKVNNPMKQAEYVLDVKGKQIFQFEFCKTLKVIQDNDIDLFDEFTSSDRELQRLAKRHLDDSTVETLDHDLCNLSRKKYYYKFTQLIKEYNSRNPLYFMGNN